MNNKTFKIILSWGFVLIWMIFIFYLSSMNTHESNSKSTNTLNNAINTTVNITNSVGLTNSHPTIEKVNSLSNKLNLPFRKCMHASVYFILTLLLINALSVTFGYKRKYLIIAVVIAHLYALTDEYHQTFVIGRNGQYRDVLIDTCGSIIACIIFIISRTIILKFKPRIK